MTSQPEAIRLDPAYTAAFYGRGLAYRAKRDTGHAIADFDEAIRLEPKFAPAFIARGVEYLDKKEYDRAIADYTEALLMKPKPIERTVAYAFTDRCWARFLVGRDLQDALDDAPFSPSSTKRRIASGPSADPQLNLCAEGADQRITGILLVPLGVGPGAASDSFQRSAALRCLVSSNSGRSTFPPAALHERGSIFNAPSP
jgi:tetratricopeptide (TPR) repeat protein